MDMVVIGLLEQNIWEELLVVWASITGWGSLGDGSSPLHLPLHLVFQAFPSSLPLTHSPEYMRCL